ncbi:MAG: flagellar hook-length control protein FliK [Nevskiaceae bacterium]|nr:MAG: flagellar hook-length control protein FliK [Nevskiaceae bacterium]
MPAGTPADFFLPTAVTPAAAPIAAANPSEGTAALPTLNPASTPRLAPADAGTPAGATHASPPAASLAPARVPTPTPGLAPDASAGLNLGETPGAVPALPEAAAPPHDTAAAEATPAGESAAPVNPWLAAMLPVTAPPPAVASCPVPAATATGPERAVSEAPASRTPPADVTGVSPRATSAAAPAPDASVAGTTAAPSPAAAPVAARSDAPTAAEPDFQQFSAWLQRADAASAPPVPPPSAVPVTLPSVPAPAAGAATATLTLPLPVHHAGWSEALGQQVVWSLGQDLQQVQIHLHPAELGPLSISLRLDQDQAQVSFGAAHAQTREALQQALPQLREMLGREGISLGQASVHSQLPQRQDTPHQGRDDASGFSTGAGATTGDETAAPVLVRRRRGLVDDYV